MIDFKRVGLGLLGIALIVALAWLWNMSSDFTSITLWNTDNIRPELSGNAALDERIIRSAGESNFTVILFAAIIWAVVVMILYNSLKSIAIGLFGGNKNDARTKRKVESAQGRAKRSRHIL